MAAIATIAMLVLAPAASAHHDRGHHHRSLDGSAGGAAGTVASFDAQSGRLAIDLTDGETVAGLVTDRTWIDCGGRDQGGSTTRQQSGSDEGSRRYLHDLGGDWWGHTGGCSTAGLVPGAVVEDAVLVLANDEATFVKIDLAGQGSS